MDKYGYIYLVKNNITKQIYIGQTIEGFDKRYKNNIQKNTHNDHLKNSITKYGIENFTIIKEFDIAYSQEELDEKEKFYISLFRSMDRKYGFNKREGGRGGRLSEETKMKIRKSNKGKHRSEETKRKMSESRKGEDNPNYNNHKLAGENHPMYGKHHSEESRRKMSESQKGKFAGEKNPMYGVHNYGKDNPNYGNKWSDEQKANASKNIKKLFEEGEITKYKETRVINLDTMEVFKSITEAKKKYKGDISKCVRGITKTASGYAWKYYSLFLEENKDKDIKDVIFV